METQSCDKQQAGCSHTHSMGRWRPYTRSIIKEFCENGLSDIPFSKTRANLGNRRARGRHHSAVTFLRTASWMRTSRWGAFTGWRLKPSLPQIALHTGTLQEGKLTTSAIQGCLYPNCELTTYTGNKQEHYRHSECKRDMWISLWGQTLTKPCTYSKLCAGTQ